MDEGERTLLWTHIQELERKVEFLMQAVGQQTGQQDPHLPGYVPTSQLGASTSAGWTPAGPPVSNDVMILVREGQKISAIKRYMKETGTSLAEAKRIIESLG
jgi:ribosomal protein L7/L12